MKSRGIRPYILNPKQLGFQSGPSIGKVHVLDRPDSLGSKYPIFLIYYLLTWSCRVTCAPGFKLKGFTALIWRLPCQIEYKQSTLVKNGLTNSSHKA